MGMMILGKSCRFRGQCIHFFFDHAERPEGTPQNVVPQERVGGGIDRLLDCLHMGRDVLPFYVA